MKFANIVPTAFLPMYGSLSNYHMALTHMVQKDKEYAGYMRRRSITGDFIIMDNSLIELGSAMNILEVADAATECQAHEIVLMDVFRKKEATTAAVFNSIVALKSRYAGDRIPFKLMAVPQGENMEEWIDCLITILGSFPEVTTIGIPKVSGTFCTDTSMGRLQVLEHLVEAKIPSTFPSIEWHMLGIWNNPIELAAASQYSWIRGCDSSIAWACAQKGILFHHSKGMLIDRPKEAIIDFAEEEDMFPIITLHNLVTMMGWANYYA